MRRDSRRITVIARRLESSREWNVSATGSNRLILVSSFPLLCGAMQHEAQDIERLILDGTATSTQFLELLASLPSEFMGDVVFIGPNKRGFLSAAARADGRVIYALAEADLQFYLETHDLVANVLRAA